jgi:hypothetical protein
MSSRPSAARRALVTVLDVAAAVLAGTALMMQLGVGGRFDVGSMTISARSPWRPVFAAALLFVIRLAIGRRLRPVPLLADPALRARLDAERDWLGRTVRAPRVVWYYALGAAAASLIWLTPHLIHIRRVPDLGDPLFSAWRLARVAHQLTHDPRHLFDGNTFYPEPLTLAYSDTTILQGLIATPFIVSGMDPLVVSNALFLSAFPLCALAFCYAGWRLTSDPRAGFVAGILGALYPFHTEHYSHFELQFFCFVPLAVLALLQLLAAPSPKRGFTFGALLVLQWLACMYFGVMLPVYLVPVALFAAVAWRIRPTKDLFIALGLAATLAAVGFSIVAFPYLRSRTARGEPNRELITFYSALPGDYGHPHPRLASYEWVSRDRNMPEREIFPGMLPIGLALAGIVPPLPVPALATLGATVLAFDASQGNRGLVYDDLSHYLLPFRSMRVPARFSAFVGCGLVLLSAYGCRRLISLPRSPRAQAAVCGTLAVLALIDLRPILRIHDDAPHVPAIYSSVTPDMVLAEFPLDQDFDYMYFSTFHWARLVNGYSGFTPASYIRLHEYLVGEFPSKVALQALRERGATHLTYNCALDTRVWRCNQMFEALDAAPELALVASERWQGQEVRLYRFR